MSLISVLVVDDSKEFQINIKKILEQNHLRKVLLAASISEMMNILNSELVDVVLLDNHLGNNLQGCDYITEIKKVNSDIEVIMFTADRTLDLIIKSVKNGAFYYLLKDNFDSIELVTLIKKAYDMKKIREDHRVLADTYTVLQENDFKFELIEESEHLSDLKYKLERLAKANTVNGILLVGEHGVGKTMLAHYYYSCLRKADKFRPFFRIKCAHLHEGNFKEVFFGSVNRKGLIETASNAVIFLDEIKDLKNEVQNYLLSLFEDKTFTLKNRIKKDNRLIIVSTSSINLKELVEIGSLNERLFYYLSSITLPVLPLRERPADIKFLINNYIHEFAANNQVVYPLPPDSIINLLKNYPWPGNVPELHAALENLLLLGYEDGKYNPNELPAPILATQYAEPDYDKDLIHILKEVIDETRGYKEKILLCKKAIIISCLKKNNYVVTKAAKELLRGRTSLHNEMAELNITIKKISGIED